MSNYVILSEYVIMSDHVILSASFCAKDLLVNPRLCNLPGDPSRKTYPQPGELRDKKADYVLALKGNHSTLHDDVRLFLSAETQKTNSTQINDCCEDFDKGHGRIEHRLCYVSDQIDWLT